MKMVVLFRNLIDDLAYIKADFLSFSWILEAVIRFLKAKLRVMQEEMDRVSSDNSKLVMANMS